MFLANKILGFNIGPQQPSVQVKHGITICSITGGGSAKSGSGSPSTLFGPQKTINSLDAVIARLTAKDGVTLNLFVK